MSARTIDPVAHQTARPTPRLGAILCTIHTGRPALFSGLTLASGVGVVAVGGAVGEWMSDRAGNRVWNRRTSSAVSKPIRH